MQRSLVTGIGLMFLAALLFSIMGALAKFAMGRLPPMQAVFFRAGVMLVFLVPWMAIKKVSFFGKNKRWLLIRSVSGFVSISLAFYATAHLTLANAAILNHTAPIFVALLAALWLGETLGKGMFGYILLAFIGAGFIIKPSVQFETVAGIAGLASGLTAAIAYVSVKYLHRSESTLTVVFGFAILAVIGSALFSPSFIWPRPLEWAALLGLGVIGTAAQLLMTCAYRYADASVIAPFGFTGVMFSALWGALFWHEVPDRWSGLGAGLVVLAGIAIVRKQRDKAAFNIDAEMGELAEQQ